MSDGTGSSGALVVIEGLDASGKRTQAERLVRRLDTAGQDAEYIEFPTYDRTRIGSLIEQYLDGGYDAPPEVAALLYAADRYQMADELEAFMADGGVVVADRYSPSNYAFQAAAADDPAMLDWMQDVERRLPQPDLVILLDIPPETA
ncbi:MAG: dTMP kinase, partial [Candidatus Nanohaloarchaea archaeon]|nr:dTMP kinase [Candidatus Nanohaloarchaea archaeon]